MVEEECQMKKVIITATVHNILIQSLSANGYEVIYSPDITYEDLLEKISDATGLVITTRIKVDKRLIDATKCLKWIGRLGSGLELIDLAYAEKKNILCYSTPEGNCTAVAEQALLLLLALKRHLVKAANEVEQKIWLRNENRGNEITNITVGIIGYGHTGSAFAQVLRGFNVKILAYDKYKSGFSIDNVYESTLKEIQENADVISFHLPLTTETKHLGNSVFFKALQKSPVILNTSRGSVINTADLLMAFGKQEISAAGLDVLENEKLESYNSTENDIFHKLQQMSNVLITPHIAGYTHEAYYKMSIFLLEKLNLEIVEKV